MLHFPIRKSTFHGSGQCIPKKEESAEEEVVTGTESKKRAGVTPLAQTMGFCLDDFTTMRLVHERQKRIECGVKLQKYSIHVLVHVLTLMRRRDETHDLHILQKPLVCY